MKNKKLAIFVVLLLVIMTASTFAQTKQLKSIGHYTLVRIRGNVPTQEVMKRLVDRYAGDIKLGFDLADASDLYLPFMDQLKNAKFEEKSLPVGDKLIWMLFRSNGKVKVVRDVEWAGKKPLDVFVFNVEKDFKNYEFAMPRPCGNISLRSITNLELPTAACAITVSPEKVNLKDPVTVDVSGTQGATSIEVSAVAADGTKAWSQTLTPDAPRAKASFDKPGTYTFQASAINSQGKASPCQATVVVNAPPVCSLKTPCVSCVDYVKKPIALDASGSSDPDGKVVKADFTITDQSGNPVDKYMASAAPFVWNKTFMAAGSYAVTVVVTDDFGAVSEPCRVVLDVTRIKRDYFGVGAGPLFARGSHGPYLFGQVDYFRWITPDKVDFTAAAGGAIALKGDPWKSFFIADATINYHPSAFFFGGGLGVSTALKEGRDSVFEIVGDLGVDVFKKPDSFGSLIFQLRWTAGKDLWDYHKILLGFRVHF
jgi:PKD domain